MSILLISFIVVVFVCVSPYLYYAYTFEQYRRIGGGMPFINTILGVVIALAAAFPIAAAWYMSTLLTPLAVPSVIQSPTYAPVMIALFAAIALAPLYYLEQLRRLVTNSSRAPAFALLSMMRAVSAGSLAIGAVLFSVALSAEPPPPYTFSGREFSVYEPTESPICVGEPVRFNMSFEVDPFPGELITIDWDTTWHRDEPRGLIGSSGTRSWVYYKPDVFSFAEVGQTPPAGVDAGVWTFAGHALVNNSRAGAGYVVTVEYVDC